MRIAVEAIIKHLSLLSNSRLLLPSAITARSMPAFNRNVRRLHRWGAIVFAIPLLLVVVTGLLLQLKKQIPWVQPPTQRGAEAELSISWDEILASVSAVPAADVASWDDVDRIDARPDRGLLKVRCKNGWEVQLDAVSAKVLSSELRRSDWIESLHDGSFFSDWAKITVFLANGLVLLGLWFTGVYLWYLPIQTKRRKNQNGKSENAQPTGRLADGSDCQFVGRLNVRLAKFHVDATFRRHHSGLSPPKNSPRQRYKATEPLRRFFGIIFAGKPVASPT